MERATPRSAETVGRSFHNDPSRLVTRRERERQTDKGSVPSWTRRHQLLLLPLVARYKQSTVRERERETDEPRQARLYKGMRREKSSVFTGRLRPGKIAMMTIVSGSSSPFPSSDINYPRHVKRRRELSCSSHIRRRHTVHDVPHFPCFFFPIFPSPVENGHFSDFVADYCI